MKLLKQFLALIGNLLPFGLVVMLALIYSGEPLDNIGGRPAGDTESRDLLRDAQFALDSGRPFECVEAELNQHIASVLEAREGDGFEMFAEFKGLWIRLREGEIELVFEREVLGLQSTVSARVKVRREDGGHAIEVSGGQFGRLPVPKGAINLLRGGIAHVGGVFSAEKDVLSRVAHVTISNGRMRLEPHPSGG